MTFARSMRRVAIAGVSLTALLAVAACGGGSGGSSGSGGSAATADFTAQGDTEFWTGKDTSGNLKNVVAAFNAQHPTGKVIIHELPEKADLQQQQMIQNTQIKNPAMGVLSMDVVWTAQFAATGVAVPLPADKFPTDGYLKATVDSATYFGKLYGFPQSSDGGLLYYRKDLLDKAGLQPPTTFDEMKAACEKILPDNDGMSCFAGQYNKYEGLTVNFAEAVNGAGGKIIGDDGKPAVNSAEAQKGLSTLADWYKEGLIPKGAITWGEEEGRQAFQNGTLLFHRNWPYAYAKFQPSDDSSKVKDKFAVAPLPGIAGPGVSSLGGHNLAIATNAAAKGTAADFVKYFCSEQVMKGNVLATSAAPTLESLYTDADIVKKYPATPTLLKSIQTAQSRPKAVKYNDVTLAIQDAAYSAMQGQTAPDAALAALQTKLETLTK